MRELELQGVSNRVMVVRWQKVRQKLLVVWQGIRELTGDDAYERYSERQKQKDVCDLLTREEFYRQRMEHKFDNKSGPARCC